MNHKTTETPYRFIPFRKRDIVEMCLQDTKLAGQEADFRQLYFMLSSIFHFEFHNIIESLKDGYAPVDPDTDTRLHDDAINKLQALELVSAADGKLSVVSIQAGIKALDKRWDDYFVAPYD